MRACGPAEGRPDTQQDPSALFDLPSPRSGLCARALVLLLASTSGAVRGRARGTWGLGSCNWAIYTGRVAAVARLAARGRGRRLRVCVMK